MADSFLQNEHLLPIDTWPAGVGALIVSAGLAHDSGNTPFGHSGEDAIQQWAKGKIDNKPLLQDFTEPQREVVHRLESNAQSLRVRAWLEGR